MSILLLSFTALLLLPAPSALAVEARPVPVQEEDEEVPDKRPEVKELIEQLGKLIKKRGEQDEEAIGTLDRLYQEFEGSGPKDRQAIVRALGACFKVKRIKELEPGVPDDRLFMAAAVAMGDMGPESAKPLIGLIGYKRFKTNLRLQRRIILSVGKTRHPSGVKPLLGLMGHKDPVVQGAGAEALGEFEDLPQKERKKIFEALLKTIMSQKNRIDSDQKDPEARDRYDVIAGPIITSLQRLSGHGERDPQEWQRWWNKNKKKNWDEDL